MSLNSKVTLEKVGSNEPNTRYIKKHNVITDINIVLSGCGDINKEFHVLEIRNDAKWLFNLTERDFN